MATITSHLSRAAGSWPWTAQLAHLAAGSAVNAPDSSPTPVSPASTPSPYPPGPPAPPATRVFQSSASSSSSGTTASIITNGSSSIVAAANSHSPHPLHPHHPHHHHHAVSGPTMMNGKSLHPSLGPGGASCFSGRYSPTYRPTDSMRRCMPNPPVRRFQLPPHLHHSHHPTPADGYRTSGVAGTPTGAEAEFANSSLRPRQCLTNLFGGLDDGLLSRAEALAAVDISKHSATPTQGLQLKHDMMYHHHHPGMGAAHAPPNTRPHQLSHHAMDGMDMLDPLGSSAMPGLAPITSDSGSGASHTHHHLSGPVYTHSMNQMVGSHHLASHTPVSMHDTESDPRELEAFAERFKQRRIKLGVTQADVGRALANLKLPGVGALSQSTICRFESLTLSHNNMIALKPVLQAWLEEAEAQARNKRKDPEAPDVLPSGEKKRKRTSIAAPEKRSLEAYFAVQPRPSGEKIAAIAEKLDLKKNVVRVWFCNQRQKQKRMKFSAVNHVNH